MATPSFAARLLRWYDANRRDLPWRRTRDPWAILVSEIMLQQTRVEAVREPYARFLARYPRPSAFAAIGDDELLTAWRGLGYYRRARFLREAARAIQRDHGDRLPDDPASLRDLPGIGAYTSGAVASIAFGHKVTAIDGNVERVFARHLAIKDEIATAPARRAVADAAASHIDRERPGDFNQALMELGAVICTPTSPACDRCPVAADCAGRRHGIAAELPRRRAPRAPTIVTARCLVVSRRGGVLAFRVPDGEPNAGQLELPGPGVLASCAPEDLARATRERCGIAASIGPELATVRHAITHHRISVTAHAAEIVGRAQLPIVDPSDGDAPWTTVARKVFARLAALPSAIAPLRR